MEDSLGQNQMSLLKETLISLEFPAVLEQISRHCISDHGKEIIHKSLPVNDISYLQTEHNLIGEMLGLKLKGESMPFESMPDVRHKLYKAMIENSVLNTIDILEICDIIRISRLIKNFFKTREDNFPDLFERTSSLYENRILEKHITEAIDDNGEVRDNASKELTRIRRDIHDKSARLRNRLQKIMKRVAEEDLVQDDFMSIREGRFVLPVKTENKRVVSGIIHGVSQSGATVFLEPSEIIEMNNELSLLQSEEKREIYRILSNLTGEIRDEARQILASVEIMAAIDSISAKAIYALEYGGIKPQITEESEIFLKNIRHPILVHTKGIKKVIPLSLDFDQMKRGHLISGPNAGGKTVALKSIGLNIAMALSGIYPLGECRTDYRTIFATIGDHQSIENDLSTFSSQILELRKILENCDPRSLVLVDEICSGTDPQEGSALAAGILDTFISLNLFFVSTTHQSSLKSYALNNEVISNASLEFNEEKLHPTYKFLTGIPGNSYAFVLAQNLGIPGLVIDRSRKYLGERHTEMEESIRILQKNITETGLLKLKCEEEKLKAEKVRQDYEIKFNEIKKNRQELLNQARDEAADILRNANSLIENTIREIREQNKPIPDIKKEYQSGLAKLKNIEDKATGKTGPDVQNLKPGDYVRLEETGSSGFLLEIEKDNIAVVDFNGVRFHIHISKLKKSTQQPEKQGKHSDYVKFSGSSVIDLRGQRADEAIRNVDELLSDAILGNIPMITIIHGKGTGALRKAIHDFLSNHNSVVSFREGNLIEGGAGVTIAEL